MPLTIHPSSTCDICLEKYSSSRQCYAIPCGHIFCGQCLSQINKPTCPLCRANTLAARHDTARKLCVDFAPTAGASGSSAARMNSSQEKGIDDALDKLVESLRKPTITPKAAHKMAQKVQTLLEDQSPVSTPAQLRRSLRVIELLALRLSVSLADLYEQSSLDKAQKASYETRIQELEKSLRKLNIKRQPSTGISRGDSSAVNRPHQPQQSHTPRHKESSSRPLESSQRNTSNKNRTKNPPVTIVAPVWM